MNDPSSLLDDQTVAVLDVETTGLSSIFDRVCEVGIVLARRDEILETYQTLVNPQRPISPGAARVNGLSDADVCDAPTFGEIAGEVLQRIDGKLLVCHNAPFDLGFIAAELGRLGFPWGTAGVIDTLEIARRQFRFGSNSLSALTARLGIENSMAHRALGDALATFRVFRILSSQLSTPSLLAGLVRSYRPAESIEEQFLLPPAIQEALARGGEVQITYVDSHGSQTVRTITPHQALAQNGVVYVSAFCHLRQEERHFRLDRIVGMEAYDD